MRWMTTFDYDEDVNDYKFTSLILNNDGIYKIQTTIITIRDGKIDILMKEEMPFLTYEPKSF